MGDMRSLPYECSFDGVINLFTSFGFFDTDEENENVLKEVAKALKPQGVFLLDTENKVHFLVHGVLKQRRTWKLGDDGRMYLIENEYDAKNGREIFRLSIISGGRIKETTGYNIRLYRYPKICRMLSRRGFDVAAVWGDYDRSAYSVDSRRQIILASKQK
jgi:SAM-dependent methyltransferase